MYDNYSFPVGADTPKAPWNRKDNEEKEFSVTCCQALSKTVPVFTDGYTAIAEREYDGEGWVTLLDYDTSNVNWKNTYRDNNHYTPIQLIELFQKYLLDEVNGTNTVSRNPSYLHHIITECNNWTEDETEVIQD